MKSVDASATPIHRKAKFTKMPMVKMTKDSAEANDNNKDNVDKCFWIKMAWWTWQMCFQTLTKPGWRHLHKRHLWYWDLSGFSSEGSLKLEIICRYNKEMWYQVQTSCYSFVELTYSSYFIALVPDCHSCIVTILSIIWTMHICMCVIKKFFSFCTW